MAERRAGAAAWVLDALIAEPGRTWLATEQEKLRHFTLTHRVPRRDLPTLTFRADDDSETTRYFPDKLPIGVNGDGPYTFLYLVTRDLPVDFRAFLERHAELLRALPAWTLRLLVPRHKSNAIPVYQAAFREQLATPLEPALLEEVRWYFHARRKGVSSPDERFDQAARCLRRPPVPGSVPSLARTG